MSPKILGVIGSLIGLYMFVKRKKYNERTASFYSKYKFLGTEGVYGGAGGEIIFGVCGIIFFIVGLAVIIFG